MAHEYSVLAHKWLKKKVTNAKIKKKEAAKSNDTDKDQYYSGQLKELLELRKFLTDKIDLNTQKYYD